MKPWITTSHSNGKQAKVIEDQHPELFPAPEEDETEEEEAIVPLRSLDIKEPMDKFEEYVSPEKVFQLNFNRKASSKAPSQQIAPTPSDEDNIEYFDRHQI